MPGDVTQSSELGLKAGHDAIDASIDGLHPVRVAECKDRRRRVGKVAREYIKLYEVPVCIGSPDGVHNAIGSEAHQWPYRWPCRWLHRWMLWSVRAAGEDRPKDPHDAVDAGAERQKQIRLGIVVLADRANHAAGMLIAECSELVKVAQ